MAGSSPFGWQWVYFIFSMTIHQTKDHVFGNERGFERVNKLLLLTGDSHQSYTHTSIHVHTVMCQAHPVVLATGNWPLSPSQPYYLYVSLLLTKEGDIWLLIAGWLYGKGKSEVWIPPASSNNTSFSSSWHCNSKGTQTLLILQLNIIKNEIRWVFFIRLPLSISDCSCDLE